MVIATICLLLPLLTGIIVTLSTAKKKRVEALLLHHLYKKQHFPHSLSEISTEKFLTLCHMAQQKNRCLTSIKDAQQNASAIPLTFDDGFASIYHCALPILQEFSFSATIYITTAHLSGLNSRDVYSHPKLTSLQIKELHNKGFEIGSHTITHRALTLLDNEEVRMELANSKKSLEKIIGSTITSLAFPLGLWNERVLALAKECGYNHFSIYNYHSKAKNRKEITPVTAIYPFDSPNDIQEKLTGNPSKSQSFLRAGIIPHFAKGSPLASFSEAYNPLRFFDRFDLVQKEKTQKKK